jgi:hypothetical protein
MNANARQKFLQSAALCFLLAGATVIITNLLTGVPVARAIGRGALPFLVGGIVLIAATRQKRRREMHDKARHSESDNELT